MEKKINFYQAVLEELKLFLSPILEYSKTQYSILDFFNLMGWDMYSILNTGESTFVNKVGEILNSFSTIEDLINNPPEDFEDFKTALDQIALIIDLFSDLKTIANNFNPPDDIDELPQDIIEVLLIIYLKNYRPVIFSLFQLIGIIYIDTEPTYSVKGDAILRVKNPGFRLDLEVIPVFLKNPIGYLKSRFLTSFATIQSTGQTGKFLFSQIADVLQNLNLDVLVGREKPAVPETPMTDEEYAMEGMMTTSFTFVDQNLITTVGSSFGLLSIPEGGPGLFVVPYGMVNFSTSHRGWNVSLSLDASVSGFEITKEGIDFYETTQKSITAELIVQKVDDQDSIAYLIGDINGTHLRIGEVLIKASLDVLDKSLLADVMLAVKNSAVVINSSNGDSFLSSILPKNGAEINFEFIIGYNNQKGLYFGGSAGLEVELPVHKKLLGINFETVNLSLKVLPDGNIPISVSASFNVDWGVLHLGIKNIGISSNLTFPKSGGNLGPVNMNIGFKFPDGVALAINADPVKGGGFLNYDAATSTYTGGLELAFSKISFAAIGIISTKLPGGQKGYSLLIIITAEFSAIQLGMGFTLNGLGGLLGLNRTMNPDVLRAGLRDKTLDSILFPKDIINNKDTIVSNIGQAFPVMEGQFMVGPMAKIGWGTPTLITIELGIILEFPEPVRLAILGVLRAILPSEDKAVLKLQINFLGIIDFTAKYLSFDASIYDSKILTFPLMGDMALRLYWGDKPNFLLSVGGFHPRYTPPPLNLPEMRRLSLILADDKNLWIGIETYFAITSNSVQFGAKVEAKAKMWEGKLNVTGALWFDVLFKFNPFYFAADMGALFAIQWKSKEILTIFINLMLEGPNPWRAQGKGTFKVVGIGVTVSFDKTFGKANAETIDPVALDAKFEEQLSHKDNWEALMPARSHQQVSWKENTTSDLIVDSGGSLRFSQKLLPLNVDMLKYGTAPISDTKRYQITKYELSQSGQTEVFNTPVAAKDLFARSEYFNMTDDEKLSKDSYESFESGVLVGSDKLSSGYAVHRKIEYEDIIIDTGFREPKPIKWQLLSGLMNVHLMDSYVSGSALSDFISVTNHNGPDKVAAINTIEERFVVVDSSNLSVVSQAFNSSAEADSFLAAQMQSNTAANEWFVANEFELL